MKKNGTLNTSSNVQMLTKAMPKRKNLMLIVSEFIASGNTKNPRVICSKRRAFLISIWKKLK
jgi:hypothetical protein